MKKIKILHVLNTNNFSGAENLVCQIIEMYKNSEKFEMIYCSPDGQIRDSLKENNISFIPLRKLTRAGLKKVINYIKPDIIHAHDIRASVLAAACKGKSIVVSHIHGNHEDMRKLSLKSLLFRVASKRIRSIIWVSNSAYSSYRFKSEVSNKSKVISNVLDLQNLLKKAQEDPKTYDYEIVFLGRLSMAKNPIRLIEVMKLVLKKVPKAKVAIIGDGELRSKTFEHAEKSGLLESIDFLGFVNNPFKLLSDAKVMVMTSSHEGTPMCVLEAMALGVPLVSTPTDGIRDVVLEGKTGFLSYENKVLANNIVLLLNDEHRRSEMSKNCLKKAKHLNDLDKYREEIEKVYYA